MRSGRAASGASSDVQTHESPLRLLAQAPLVQVGVPSLVQALAPGPSEPGLGRLDPASPQAAGGIEEDLGVHGVPGQVAVAVAPAREGDDDAVSQHGQRLGDQLLLQLVGGGQVPEQPWGTAGSAGPGHRATPLDPAPAGPRLC